MEDKDKFAAWMAAIEFMIRQLYADAITRSPGDPVESALATQGRAMEAIKSQISALPEGEKKRLMQMTATHVNRLFEEIVQTAERRSQTDGKSA